MSTSATIAGCSRRSSLPASWLPGLLLLALVVTAPFVLAQVVLALLLIEALGSSAVAGKLAKTIAAVIGLPARYAFLATEWRSSSGREYRLKRLTAR